MSLLDVARDALKDIPISEIIRERLSLALDQCADAQRQVEGFKADNARLQAKLEIVTSERDEAREELQRLKDEHSEEVRILRMVEFRRGKRTGGKWQAFCPKCHLPAGEGTSNSQRFAVCSGTCGWNVDITSSLESLIPALEQGCAS